MKCAVTRDENGNILNVVSQNGNQSKLYYDLLFQLNDPELALREYALTFTKSFNDNTANAVKDNNGEHTIDTYNRYNEGSLSTIKPGVAELFESNPELANSVYEAIVPKGYTRLYRAENEKGVDSPAPSWVLEQPEVIAQQEAQGRWFYKSFEEAKYHADKFGSSGISYIDVPTNEVENYNAKNNKFSGGYGKDGKEYFVSKELANTKKSFEQQKQQALQVYSQYLDTIFPDSKVKDIVYHGTHTRFNKFDKSLSGSKTKASINGKGFFFSNSLGIAQGYRQSLEQSNIYNDVIFYYYFKRDLANKNIKDVTQEEWQEIVLNYFGSEDLNVQYLQTQSLDKTKELFEKFKNDKQFNTVQYVDELDFSEYLKDDSIVYSALLEVNNPLVVEGNNYQMLSIVKKEIEKLEENNDSIIFNNVEDGMSGSYRGVANTYTVFEPEQIHILGNKQDIQGFKDYVGNVQVQPTTLDKTLLQKLQTKLQRLYPEIKLNITNNPIWEKGDNIFNQEEFNNQVQYRIKAVDILSSDKAKQVFEKGVKNNWTLDKILSELSISKEQKQLILDLNKTNREEIITDLLANYSYTIEINTAKEKGKDYEMVDRGDGNFEPEPIEPDFDYEEVLDEEGNVIDMRPVLTERGKKQIADMEDTKPTQYYYNLTVPGGTNYTENEIATPAITPNIKGHAQFATDKGIGWFRSDVQSTLTDFQKEGLSKEDIAILSKRGEPTKTRRILELQSDLFQKGRDKEVLSTVEGINYNQLDNESKSFYDSISDKSKNQFLQLLNKDNNWVTFFVKSIIQDSAKKGYEKVLFPTGNTASKVEGHTTLEEFKKQKEDRIKELEKEKSSLKEKQNVFSSEIIDGTKVFYLTVANGYKKDGYAVYSDKETSLNKTGESTTNPSGVKFDYVKLNSKQKEKFVITVEQQEKPIDNEINQLKQELERVEREGFAALKPIYNFYENTVTNILNKQFGKEFINQITDEYGNTWNELNINQARDLSEVLLQRNEANQIIGQANIKAMTVLIDAVNQKQDTLPHEYAHHYISWFRDTPIVQEGIKRFGSEEALVQAIGEQVVKQKGEAYNWWNNFVKWIMDKFNSLSTLDKKQLTQILTDAFLTRQDLRAIPTTLDIGFNNNPETEYYQLDDTTLSSQYSSQLENATEEQKKTFDKIATMHEKVYKEVIGDDVNTGKPNYAYFMKDHLGNDVQLESATTYLNKDPKYEYTGKNTDDTFINWGNVADMMLSGIIEGKSVEQIEDMLNREFPLIEVNEIMTQDARVKLYKEFNEYVKQEKDKGNILLTQIRHGNLNKKIGGTADIVIIQPDGKIKYADLKTSYKPFIGTDSTFKKEFRDNPFIEKASKYDRYSAQLSIYAAIGESNNLPLDFSDPVSIIPIKLETEESTAYDVEFQGEQSKYYTKAQYKQSYKALFSNKYSSKSYQDIFNRLIQILEQSISTYRRKGDDDTANELEDLVKGFDNTEYYSGIVSMITTAHDMFIGNKDSLNKILNSLLQLDSVNVDNISGLIKSITDIETMMNLYHPTINSPLQILSSELANNKIVIEDDSIASKLNEVLLTISNMRESIQQTLPPLLAEYLVSSIPANANDNIIKKYEALLKKVRVVESRGGNEKKLDKLKKELEDFELQFNISEVNGKPQPDLQAMLEREIRDGGYKDISTLDRVISSAIQMPVGFLATFAVKVKTALEEARQIAINELYKADKEFKEFMQGRSFTTPDKQYKNLYYSKGLYSFVNGVYTKTKNVLGLVSYIDYNKFNEAKAQMYKEASTIEDARDRSIFISNWYKENTQVRPGEDVKEGDLVLVEAYNTIYKRKLLSLGEGSARFQAWESRNTYTDRDGKKQYKGELQIPNLNKYQSEDFKRLKNNPSEFKLYKSLMKRYLEAQSKQPQRSRDNYEEYKYIAPYIQKSSMDRLTDNGIKSLVTYKAQDLFKKLDDDANQYSYDPNTKSVHILYYSTANPVDYNDTSKDLVSSILQYSLAASRYQKRTEMAIVGESLLNRVRKTNPLYVDSDNTSVSFKTVTDKVDKFLGKRLKSTGNNAADMLQAFIEQQIYGITRRDAKIGNIDLNKLADGIMSFGAITQLGFDITLAISNSLTANVSTAIEAAGGRIFGLKPWLKAAAKYNLYEYDFIRDATSTTPKSFIGQLVDVYDPMQGDFVDNYGRKIGKSLAKEKWTTKQAFTGLRKGEHRAQVTAMIALLNETKVKYINPKTGQESLISLMDAYEIPEGQTRIQLKEGVELGKQVGLVDINVQNKLHSVNTSIHGIYNSFESPDLARDWYGRLLLMYRKYLPAGLKARFKNDGFNYQTIDFTKGYYLDFYRTLFTDFKELVNALTGKDTYLDEWEMANLRKALVEHAVVLGTGLLVLALQAALEGEDDDERDALKWVLYTTLRLNQEISMYGAAMNPLTNLLPNHKPLIKTFTTVSAATTTVTKMTDLISLLLEDSVNLLTGDDIERYQRDAGFFQRGDSKTYAAFLKLIGVNNRKLLQDPEDSINLLVKEKGASN